jgi:hypothetical protein
VGSKTLSRTRSLSSPSAALTTKVAYPVQTWTFGDALAIVHLPGDLVADYQLRLEKELDGRRLWVTGYASNAPCYVPSARVLKEGGSEGAVKDHIGKPFGPKIDSKKTSGSPPLSPQQSLALIKTKPGSRGELVAAEPVVYDPVALAFGPDGKLWVVEMAGYPSGNTGKFDPGARVVPRTHGHQRPLRQAHCVPRQPAVPDGRVSLA